AVFLYLSSAVIEACLFESNLALSSGGAIQMNYSAPVVRDCMFRTNGSEDWAGAVQVLAGSPSFEGSVFSGNTAVSEGGAMVLTLDSALGGDVPIADSTFIANEAGIDAGGVLVIGTLHDLRLIDTAMCENLPNDLVGPWVDEGGNASCLCNVDLDGNGMVDGPDLSILLGAWGPCDDAQFGCPEDLTWDGVVDGADLAFMLSRWGLCEE
ncbi:MAG: hypothetical protein MK082_04775, partial [Phycisphaerales bacterium]|nr:hypothetical protein [Phycisphaerales bacterium]